ncbi:MAG: putative toxin-antitoxin system toxin component, PIN family [Candidatus Rokuibacteriota bacterium]|nr:MAG: putative toxin-antitoxin system toxin component, PIN family [Candidatus Rokubacteria bacterium]
MLKALVDTNPLVSSLLSPRGLQRQLIDAWRRRQFLLLLVPGQIDEVSEVLARPKIARKYRIVPNDREAFIQLLTIEAIVLPHEPAPEVCRDPDDDYLLGCAALGGAHYLVTGDDDLLTLRQYRNTVIVDARTFLSVLAAQRG